MQATVRILWSGTCRLVQLSSRKLRTESTGFCTPDRQKLFMNPHSVSPSLQSQSSGPAYTLLIVSAWLEPDRCLLGPAVLPIAAPDPMGSSQSAGDNPAFARSRPLREASALVEMFGSGSLVRLKRFQSPRGLRSNGTSSCSTHCACAQKRSDGAAKATLSAYGWRPTIGSFWPQKTHLAEDGTPRVSGGSGSTEGLRCASKQAR